MPIIVDPTDHTHRKRIEPDTAHEELLVAIMRGGRLVYDCPPLSDSRARTMTQLASLHPSIRRFVNPHRYPAGLELGLHDLKTELILEARSQVD
ncbi:MAG: nicotinate phosphoribosyltransferase [Gammaproteobacteria bacterium]|jgi:nicotinate phosphoribosyltransferase